MRVAKALLLDADGWALVLRRSGTHPTYAYLPDLPGGIIENGESYETGLTREIQEEAGITIDPSELRLLAKKKQFGHSDKRLYSYRFKDRPTVHISWEHDEWQWVQPEQLREALGASDTFITFTKEYLKQNPVGKDIQ